MLKNVVLALGLALATTAITAAEEPTIEWPGTYDFVPGCAGCVWGYTIKTTTGELWKVGLPAPDAHEPKAASVTSPATSPGPTGRYRLLYYDSPKAHVVPFPCLSRCTLSDLTDALNRLADSIDDTPTRLFFFVDTGTGATWAWSGKAWTAIAPPMSAP